MVRSTSIDLSLSPLRINGELTTSKPQTQEDMMRTGKDLTCMRVIVKTTSDDYVGWNRYERLLDCSTGFRFYHNCMY